MRTESIVHLLPHTVESVIETHVSTVYVCAHYVFKFKKDVHLSFVDYSTWQRRLQFAGEELRLNRRLTSGVYRGIAIFEQDESRTYTWRLSLLEPPDAAFINSLSTRGCECAVVMRRLDDRDFLVSRVQCGDKELPQHVQELAHVFCNFAARNSITPPDPHAHVCAFEEAFEDNFRTLTSDACRPFLGPVSTAACRLSRDYFERYLEQHRHRLVERVRAGRVIEGHGDFRLEHVCVEGRCTQIFDCVEFNDDFRRHDVASEIAFLIMDLERFFRGDLADIFSSMCAQNLHDQELASVLPFFKTYRATVRAKVHATRLLQLAAADTVESKLLEVKCKLERYLALASRYALGVQGPLLITMHGLMGTGKSTVADVLSALLHARVIRSDEVRRELPAPPQGGEAYGAGAYSVESVQKVYDEMFRRAGALLQTRNVVILDATFITRSHREQSTALAKRYRADSVLCTCALPRALQLERVAERSVSKSSASQGRVDLVELQAERSEPILETENFDSRLVVDTSQEELKQIVEFLSARGSSKTQFSRDS